MTLRIAFLGTPDFAVPTLAALVAQGHDIPCVYSQPPRPKGRGLAENLGPVHEFALASHIAVRTPLTLKDVAQQELFASLGADVAVVVAYGLLLPQAVLSAPRLGCINLHASLLPRWRGAAPIQRAVMAGDAETGVMTMQMEAGLDTGPVLMAERLAIGRKTAGELHDALAHLGADLMVRTLGALERGSITATPQTGEPVYAKKITKDEARIDWAKPAAELDCLIRGLSPFPGAWCMANGERLKVLYAEPVSGNGVPGTVLDDALTIACGDGALRLVRVQRAGKAVMAADELLRGFALPPGTRLA